MPNSPVSIFQTPHDTALEALGALPGGRVWGAFDVPKLKAEKGLASRYVFPLWDRPSSLNGVLDATSKALAREQDGTWWYHIRRPPPDANSQWKAQWDSLRLSQRQGLPVVGVLKERKTSLCALEVTFDCGPFVGSFDAEEVSMQARPRDARAAELLASHYGLALHPPVQARLEQESRSLDEARYFTASDLLNERERRLREVVQRRGQAGFRRDLLAAYGRRCAVTGCDAEDALEAAHIVGYLGPATQHVCNGLLLRADIHSLFDLGLLGICPDSLRLHLAPSLRTSSYAPLHGQALALPRDPAHAPDPRALRARWQAGHALPG